MSSCVCVTFNLHSCSTHDTLDNRTHVVAPVAFHLSEHMVFIFAAVRMCFYARCHGPLGQGSGFRDGNAIIGAFVFQMIESVGAEGGSVRNAERDS